MVREDSGVLLNGCLGCASGRRLGGFVVVDPVASVVPVSL